MEKARYLLFDAQFDKSLWGETFLAAVYLINRLETSTLQQQQI